LIFTQKFAQAAPNLSLRTDDPFSLNELVDGYYGYGGTDIQIDYQAGNSDERCVATGGWSGEFVRGTGSLMGIRGSKTIRAETSTDFILECFADDGTSTGVVKQSLTIIPLFPTVQLSASIDKLTLPVGGGIAKLSWNATGEASKCTWEAITTTAGAIHGTLSSLSGERDFDIKESWRLTIECQNESAISLLNSKSFARHPKYADLKTSQVLIIGVDTGRPSGVSIHMEATPTGLPTGPGDVQIIWSAVNSELGLPPPTCQALDWENAGSTTLAPNGGGNPPATLRSTPITVTTSRTFSMECQNKWETTRKTVSVKVNGIPPVATAVCNNNGTKEAGEACDDGTNNGFCPKTCSTTCAINNACASSCTPSSACATSTCVGSTCSDGCGGTVSGTKVCTGSCTPSSACATSTCVGSTCSDGCSGTVSGTKACSSVIDLSQPPTTCSTGFVLRGKLCFPDIGSTSLSNMSVLDLLKKVMNWILSIIAVLAIIAFVISGVQYLVSAGDEDMAETAKRNMTSAIIGLAVALSGLIIVSAIAGLLGAG
jgi:hypothetical protein